MLYLLNICMKVSDAKALMIKNFSISVTDHYKMIYHMLLPATALISQLFCKYTLLYLDLTQVYFQKAMQN